MRSTLLPILVVLALVAVAPAAAEKEHKINLRLKAQTLEDGDNPIYTFESQGILIARASRNKIVGYDLDTLTRMRLPMKHAATKDEVLDEPAGSIDTGCIEWRERCYEHKAVKIRACDTVCTKIYDPASKQVLPVTDPETIYVAITSNVVDFRDSALKSDDPQYLKKRAPR